MKYILQLSDTPIEVSICPVCGEIGDGEIFISTHFNYCTYFIYRVHENINHI